MGKFATTGVEQAQTVFTGAMTATSTAPGAGAFGPLLGNFNVAVTGTFVGTALLVCSFDGGATWVPVINKHTGTNTTFTAPGALQEDEVEPGVLYGMICTAFTSGTINYRLSEGAAGGRVERLS